MANYYIVLSGYTGTVPAGYTAVSPSYDGLYVTSGVRVASGDNVIVSSTYSGNVNIITRSGLDTKVNVTIEGGSASSQTVSFPNYGSTWSVEPTITVADGVDASRVTIDGSGTDGMTVNVGDNARLGNITGGTGSGDANVITTGTGSTVGNITGGDAADTITINGRAGTITTNGGADRITVGETGTVGNISAGAGNNVVTVNGTAGTIVTGNGNNAVALGDGATTGSITLGNGSDTITAGDNVSTGSIALGDGGTNGDHVTFGSGANINGSITQEIGDHDSRVLIGNNSTISGTITLRGGNDEVEIGDGSYVGGLVDIGSAVSTRDNDTLTIGNRVTLDGGFQTEERADVVTIGLDPVINGPADLYLDADGNDVLNLAIRNREEDALKDALAAAGYRDNGNGTWVNSGNYDFTWNGVTYTDVEHISFFFPCFARGTLIETDRGAVAIEDLAEGDLVQTRDNGMQPIRWIGSRHLPEIALNLNEKLRPIRIKAGALGAGLPATDLLVSPQHRILVRSRIAQRMFGTDEVLIAAKQLCQIEGIDIATDLAEVEYFHMLFDRHEVVTSNGAETESLFTGPEALKAVGPAAREEIFAIFPELKDRDYTPVPARLLPSGRMGRKLAVRHAQNGKPLVM
ncbi:MAG: Hint domain-containing protein [Paracoccus sp. (in: a-proteobacteria)]|uniref:Hint domain-containing protein n=1 Tax=Paracoccus sp. TaxID=267 RepID=UPI0026DF7A21|nr:Hint domain-containing protein [Paracoccus sp. (in: a-proteobacteria)]MDO5620623.1 Hint domain-containing protein [Paracoccus sp. (in: a-proteobacteria)]